MNPLKQIIYNNLAKKAKKNKPVSTQKEMEKEIQILQIEFVHAFKETLFIGIGVFAAGFGLKGFLLPNKFIDGGATGVSLLIELTTKIPLGILLLVVNLPFIILGAKTINKKFAVKSILAIFALALVVHFIEFPTITDDKLLIAFFGGFFLGLGIGMSIRGGGVIDGTEILAIYLGRKFYLTVGDVLLVINIIIFSIGACLLSIETALYAILTYLVAARTVDFIVEGVEEYIGITIISEKHEEIRKMITKILGRACTVYLGKQGYNYGEQRKEKEIIYTVVTRLELAKLSTEIDKIDKNAFMVMDAVKDIKGGMIKKKPLK